jgi:hypothetical protein
VSETDAQEDRDQEQDEGQQASGEDERIGAQEAADRALTYLEEMSGQEPEVVVAVEPDDDRWLVQVELLELARVPDTTDVLGCYEVAISFDGEPLAYHRTRRYHRGSVGER